LFGIYPTENYLAGKIVFSLKKNAPRRHLDGGNYLAVTVVCKIGNVCD
jgi:hypothetical protein